MSGAFARGACPGLSAPMSTGDGLLTRLVVAGPIPLDAFVGLCDAARMHGNGIMEISARGSLQIRGLNAVSAPLFAAAVMALPIAPCETVPILCDPLPGDPTALIESQAIAASLRQAIGDAALALAPKVSVVIDGGGRIGLDAVPADIRLRAVPTSEGPRLHVALAGDASSATEVGVIAPQDVVDAVLALLSTIAASGIEARAADLLPPRDAAAPRTRLEPRAAIVGLHPLKGGVCAIGVGLAFGHAEAAALKALAEMAMAQGARWARPAPDRTLLLGPLGETQATTMSDEAQRLGFVTEAADPRRRIVACAGAPACASGLIAARSIAAEIARDVPLAGEGVALHVSGCAKGCAHPAPAPLTIVGTEQGCGIIANDTARVTPSTYLDQSQLAAMLRGEPSQKRETVHA
jgi:precorrin-3B synthase